VNQKIQKFLNTEEPSLVTMKMEMKKPYKQWKLYAHFKKCCLTP